MGAQLIYWILYAIVVIGALMVLLNRDTVKSALSLVMVMCALAAHYFLMGMEFVGAIQIIVYAGAIMVLFLFVIMLLNMRELEVLPWYLRNPRYIAIAASVTIFFVLVLGIRLFSTAGEEQLAPAPVPSIPDIATLLTTKFAVPFILTSILLLVAVIGAVVMGRRHDTETGEELIPEETEAS